MATHSRLDSHPARSRRRTARPARLRLSRTTHHHAQHSPPGASPCARCGSLAATRVHGDASNVMKIHVELPESLAAKAQELAAREQTTVDALIASSLAATLDHVPHRPTIAERSAR